MSKSRDVRRQIVTLFCLLLFSRIAISQGATITVSLPSQAVQPAAAIQIPMNVTNFNNVGAITFKIAYNNTVLNYSDLVSNASGVTFTAGANNGMLSIAWVDMSGTTPLNFGSGVLLNINFTVLGASGTSTALDLTTQCELGDNLGDPIPGVVYTDGSVTVGSNNPPTVSAVSPNSGEFASSIVLDATSSDPDAGDAVTKETYSYTVDGGANWISIGDDTTPDDGYAWDETLNAAAVKIRAKAYDGEAWSTNWREGTGTFLIDNTKPVTSDNTPAAWQTANFIITLTRNDGTGSGFDGSGKTYFSTNGSTPETVGTSIPISTSGIYTIKYYSVDDVGNREVDKTAANQARLDKEGPSFANWTRTPSDITTATTGAVTVTVDVSDAVSGLGSGKPQLDYYFTGGAYDGYQDMTLVSGTTWSFAIPEPSGGWTGKKDSQLFYKVGAADVAGNNASSPEQAEVIQELGQLQLLFSDNFDSYSNWNYASHADFASYPPLGPWIAGDSTFPSYSNGSHYHHYANINGGILSGIGSGYSQDPNNEYPMAYLNTPILLDGSSGFAVEFRARCGTSSPNVLSVKMLSNYIDGSDQNAQTVPHYDFRITGEYSGRGVQFMKKGLSAPSQTIFSLAYGSGMDQWHTWRFERNSSGVVALYQDGVQVTAFTPPAETELNWFNRVNLDLMRSGGEIDWIKIYGNPTSSSSTRLVWAEGPAYGSDGVHPDPGSPSTFFNFKIKYIDPEGDAPKSGFPRLVLKRGAIETVARPYTLTAADEEPFTTGRSYSVYVSGLALGDTYNYFFEAFDAGDHPAGVNANTTLSGPVVSNLVPGFVNMTASAGLPSTIHGNGVAWGDYDQDGYLDLLVGSNGGANNNDPVKPKLFHNDGSSGFTDVTSEHDLAGLPGSIGSTNFIDYDRDGDPDIYLGGSGLSASGYTQALFRNDAGVFHNVTQAANLTDNLTSVESSAWGDFNNDGWIDVFLAKQNDRLCLLYKNNGDGTFSEVSVAAGINIPSTKKACIATVFDFDKDGDVDIFLTDNHNANYLYRNNFIPNGTFTFTNTTAAAGLTGANEDIGIDAADFNNDLYPDIAIGGGSVGIQHELFINNGAGVFSNQAAAKGVTGTNGRGIFSFDYDGDGDLDLFINHWGGENSQLFHNNNGLFADSAASMGVLGNIDGTGAAQADYDNDGYVDFFANGLNIARPGGILYKNRGHARNWLTVKLRGVQSNTDGIGARIELLAGGQWQMRQILAGSSLQSQNALEACFGLGSSSTADSIKVYWPSGTIQKLANVSSNQKLTIVEVIPNHAPAVTAISPGSGSYQSPLNLSATFNDPDQGDVVEKVQYQYSLDGTTGWTDIAEDASPADGYAWTTTLNSLTVWLRARAFDGEAWGSWYTNSNAITIDTETPAFANWATNPAAITTQTTGAVVVTVDITDNLTASSSLTATLSYHIGTNPASTYAAMTKGSGNSWSFSIPEPAEKWSSHGGESLYFSVRALDLAGNLGQSTEQNRLISNISTCPWTFTNTGKNAVIGIKTTINPTLDGQPLQSGDVIGVFFTRDGLLICGGFEIWTGTNNISITAYGDDDQTPLKDGFAENELFQYKVWDASAGKEFSASVTYQSGGPNYTTNGIAVLASLQALSLVTHTLNLPSGWGMISSYVIPQASEMEILMADINSALTIVKNGAGQVYWPELEINSIGSWDYHQGYQIHMKSASSLTITGQPVIPESTPISLKSGWNLIAYLRSSNQPIADAFSAIYSSLTIAKNGSGKVYWPELEINSIETLLPGQGYQLHMKQAATLTYGANTLGKDQALAARSSWQPSHYQVPVINSGGNLVIGVRGEGLEEGDEISAWDRSGHLLAAGAVCNHRTCMVVYGDDSMTTGIKEGPREGESVQLRLWRRREDLEKLLDTVTVQDVLAGIPQGSLLSYQSDAVLLVTATAAANLVTSCRLEQNYPNPFNPETTIRYELPDAQQVHIAILNLQGQLIRTLVNEQCAAGSHTLIWDGCDQAGRPAASGLYLVRMQAGDYRHTIKISFIK